MRLHRHHPGRQRGFSLIELLLVAAIGAVIFSAGALAFRAVTANQRTAGSWQTVVVPQALVENFFGGGDPHTVDSGTDPWGDNTYYIDSYIAPNYGRCAQADTLRTRFLEDVEKSIAVFALPRINNINTIRPDRIRLGNGVLPQSLDTPAAFRAFLASGSASLVNGSTVTDGSTTAAAASSFISYRGAPPETASYTSTSGTTTTTVTGQVTNATVFLLAPSGSPTELWLRAVYEIDYINVPVTSDPTSPDVPCVLAGVRRYVGTTLTHFYDVVYRNSAIGDAGIPCVHFERSSRAAFSEAASIQRFKIAENNPAYLIWWPDPGVATLKGTASAASYTGSQPQSAYSKHEGQTSYTFVAPQFPSN
jgi:prepilin-type N-terminal cleavage/methylation domain-containing protein